MELDLDLRQFEERKRDHIRHSLDPAHQASGLAGLDRIHLSHDALADLDREDVTLQSTCLGAPSPTPFFVAGMTAGHADAAHLNRTLALACAKRGWAMGVGSQRRQLHDDPKAGHRLDEWQVLREEAPGLRLYANLGISQLIRADLAHVRKLIESIRAQAIMIHLNALQEAIQPEGTPQFKGALQAIRGLCDQTSVPVVLKETGCGFSPAALEKAAQLPIAAIDVSGLGGTHWGRIEGARAAAGTVQARAAETFRNWGESTVDSVIAARAILPSRIEIWATGGVRNGLDAAKLLALGAVQVGYAKPALEAALQGPAAVDAWMAQQEFELTTALFCTGSESARALREKKGIWKHIGS